MSRCLDPLAVQPCFDLTRIGGCHLGVVLKRRHISVLPQLTCLGRASIEVAQAFCGHDGSDSGFAILPKKNARSFRQMCKVSHLKSVIVAGLSAAQKSLAKQSIKLASVLVRNSISVPFGGSITRLSPPLPVPLPPALPHTDLEIPVSRMPPDFHLMQPIYSRLYPETVRPRHIGAVTLPQRIGLRAVILTRNMFDYATGYRTDKPMTETMWLRRILFLETVAGVPGMVGGLARHLKSLRTMSKDGGWIHTLLEEAENERMHLLVFLQLKQSALVPSFLFRCVVITAQGIFFNLYLAAYLLSPKTCHAFVGYLEEEAVKTYTHALEEIDAGRLWSGRLAPEMGIEYWDLSKGATMRDLVLAVRADEAAHSHVNHTFASMPATEMNPFKQGTHEVL